MNERIKRILARGVPLLVLAALCTAAMLYHFAYFELPFIDRPDADSETTRAPEVTKAPGQAALESQLAGLATGDSISHIVTPGTDTVPADTTAAVTTAAETYPTLAALEAEGYAISYADWDEGMQLAALDFSGSGFSLRNVRQAGTKTIYTLRARQYAEDGERYVYETASQAARYAVELYGGYIMADLGGGMVALAQSDGTLIGRYSWNDLVPAYTRDQEDRPLFRTEEGGEEGDEEETATTVYYYLDATGALVRSDYNPDTDGRGLNFDYTPDYGKSDNNLIAVATEKTETLVDELNLNEWYGLGSIDADLAEPIYRIAPSFANKIAERNPLFKRALMQAMAKVRQEEREAERAAETADETTADLVVAVTASGQEMLVFDALTGTLRERVLLPDEVAEPLAAEITAALPEETTTPEPTAESTPETTVPAETTVEPIPETTIPAETTAEPAPETTIPAETTAEPTPETTIPEETTAEPIPETTIPAETTTGPTPETTIPAETTTEPTPETTIPDETTAEPAPETTTPEETTAEPAVEVTAPGVVEFEGGSGYITADGLRVVIERQVTRIKWGYQYETGWTLVYPNYLRAYAFSEGRAAVIDSENRLIFLGTNGYRSLPNKSWANEWVYLTNENSRYVAAAYAAPLYNDLSGIGHLYYDRGYVRVRELERDYSYRESITADRELLIDTAGNEFEIPSGYTLAGYSDGVLLLERDGKYGYYSTGGYWIAQPVYTYAQPFLEGLGVIGFEDGVTGAVNTEGRIVIPFTYEYISAPSSGVIACYDDEDGWTILVKVAKAAAAAPAQ